MSKTTDEDTIAYFGKRAVLAISNERAMNKAIVDAIKRLVAYAETSNDPKAISAIYEVCSNLLKTLDETTGKAEEIDSASD